MYMYVEVTYNGHVYVGKSEHSSQPIRELAHDWSNKFTNMVDKLILPLEDGSFLIIGKEALEKCIVRIVPNLND